MAKRHLLKIITRPAEKAKDEVHKRVQFGEALTVHRYEVGDKSRGHATSERIVGGTILKLVSQEGIITNFICFTSEL